MPETLPGAEVDTIGFRDLDPDGVVDAPFFERYNSRLEMPLSWSLAVLFMLSAFGLILLFGYLASGTGDRKPVPVVNLGDDDSGAGSAGSGGASDPLALGSSPQQSDIDRLMKEQNLAKIKEEMRPPIAIDGSSDQEMTDAQAAAIGTLHKDIRDKLNGQKRGSGNPNGTGGDPGSGTGPGGTGSDSTRARTLRWIIKFDTRSGRDYIEQIGGLGGILFVQTRDDNAKLYVFKDLRNPQPGTIASSEDVDRMAKQLRFEDIRARSVEAVAEALHLGYTPPVFFAVFPQELEDKLARLERQYKNKPSEQIRETTYSVIRRGGNYDLEVTDQKFK